MRDGGRGRRRAIHPWAGAGIAALLAVPLLAHANPPAPAPAPAPTAPASPITDRARQGRVAPPALEDVEQVCALLTSCTDLPIPASMVPGDFAACVRAISGQLASPAGIAFSLLIRECGLRANSCSELKTCALRGASPTACAGRGKENPVGYCDIDGRALSCFHEKVAAVRDCPRGGEQCSVREGQSACSLGACPPEIPEGAAPVCSASGTRIVRCEHGGVSSLDCAAFGLICSQSPGAGAACAPPTPACAPGPSRCDGDTEVSCYNGHEVRVDCAAAGMTCGGTASGGPRAVGSCMAPAPSGASCNPDTPARCDGARVSYCSAGRPRSYLCRTLGWNRCVSAGGSVRCG
jgi:hypothetical protein